MKGRGNPIGDWTPSPQPSPLKGEGEEFVINIYFWEEATNFQELSECVIFDSFEPDRMEKANS